MLHVADRIDVNQQTYAGDDQQHDGREPVDDQVAADIERAALDPGEVVLRVGHGQRIELAEQRQYEGKRGGHRADGDQADNRLRQPFAKQTVQQKADEREKWE